MDEEDIALLLVNAQTYDEFLFGLSLFKINGTTKNKMKRLFFKEFKKNLFINLTQKKILRFLYYDSTNNLGKVITNRYKLK